MKQTTDLILGLRSSSAGLLPKGSKNGQPDTTAPIGSSHCHSNSNHHHPSAPTLLCRAILVLTLLAGWGMSAYALVFNTSNTMNAGAVTVTKYAKNNLNEYTFDALSITSALPNLTNSNIYIRWDIRKVSTGENVQIKWNPYGNEGVIIAGLDMWVYQHQHDNDYKYGYFHGKLYPQAPLDNIVGATYRGLSSLGPLDDYVLECYISQNIPSSWPAEYSGNPLSDAYTEPNFDLKYEVFFNETGEEPVTDVFPFDGDIATTHDPITQKLDSRTATSVTLDWTKSANTTAAMNTTDVRYARFFVVDANGNPVDATDLLTVNGGIACENPAHGYYFYNSGNIFTLPTVTLSASPTATLLGYQVKCWLATATTGVAFDTEDPTKMTEEPDITDEYVYSFEKPLVTETNVIAKTIDWSKFDMNPNASTYDIATEWDAAWEDLLEHQYVKWYVIDASNTVQRLAVGTERQTGTWTINLGEPFAIVDNKAVLTGESSFTEEQWNEVWGKPCVYAPAGLNFGDVKNCKVICEVSERADASATPNVRYEFTIVKSFLGELKEGGSQKGEVMVIDNGATSVTVPLGKAKMNGTAKYARVWLTDIEGEAIIPDGMLSVTGMSTFDGHPSYGFYVSNESGISLSDATLTLSPGSFPSYQVHVALSSDAFSDTSTNEPDYDLAYTFGFQYDFKTKYRTISYIQNGTTITVNPQLLTNWYEVAGDCDVSRQGWADNGSVHWYLINVHTGERIQMDNTANTNNGYTYLGVNGWQRTGFDKASLTRTGENTYNPNFTFTLPTGLTTDDVRLVCDAGISEMIPVQNLYSTFEDGTSEGWNSWGNNSTRDIANENGNHSLHLVNPTANTNPFAAQLAYTLPSPLQPNTQYTIRFKAKSTSANGRLQFLYQKSSDYGHQVTYDPFTIGTEWNTYELSFRTQYNDDNRILFNFATVAAEYWIDDIELETLEPVTNIRVKYVFDLMTQAQLQNLNETFVHYQGETHRPYQIVDGNPGATEASWNYTNGRIDNTTYASQNIRQGVHQVDYYIYLNAGETADLALPLEGWSNNDHDNPSGTEPQGFYRWYDWNTDCTSEHLTQIGTMLTQNDRGLICNWIGYQPMIHPNAWDSWSISDKFRNLIGVDFTAPASFSNEIVVACDVSRYMDGLDDSKRYLVHEPTLSIRYLFHILPATTIANEIDSKASMLEGIEAGLKDGSITSVSEDSINNMFKLTEDNGRVVVSLKGTQGKFTLRVNLKELGHYRINVGENQIPCSDLHWYAYYQDENGALWKHRVNMNETVYLINTSGYNEGVTTTTRDKLRLAKYELSDFLGSYTKLAPGNETMTLNSLPSGANLHIVGCVGVGEGNSRVEKPVSSYDLVFLDAAPKPLGTETTQIEQTYASEMNVGAVLTFDDLFSDDESIRLAKPTSSAENYALMPQQWPLGQYGYCYPSLYGQDASSWAIYHSYWNGYGIGPTHSDYMLLKSMNMPGVSYTAGRAGDPPAGETSLFDTQSYYAWWYSEIDGVEGQNRFPKLFDVTHERLYGKEYVNDGDDAKYGTYMYIDASDEARTYASLEFDASLCAGAQIYYTAYIANMAPNVGRAENSADRKAPPQVMFRVTTDVDVLSEDGKTKIGTKRIPVVSFLTGDIESMGANKLGVWYMVSGHTQIPAELEELLDGTPRHFYVSIDNFAENTKGADYCVDEITFYTTSAKVKAHVTSRRCDPGDGVLIRVDAEAEALLKALGDGTGQKNIFYRIYKKHDDLSQPIQEGEDFTGHDVYTDGSGAANDQYGTVVVNLGFDLSTVPAYDPDAETVTLVGGVTPNSGFYSDADGVVHFQFVERRFDLTPGQGYFVSFYDFGYDRVSEPKDWGNPYLGSACTVYSNYFFSNKVFLKPFEANSEQAASGVIDFACGITDVKVDYNLKLQYPQDDGTYVVYDNVHFDFFLGKILWGNHETAEGSHLEGNSTSEADFVKVKDALRLLRLFNKESLTYAQLRDLNINVAENKNADNSLKFTDEMRTLLLSYMDPNVTAEDPYGKSKLLLEASTKFEYKFTAPNENYFQAIAVEEETNDGEDICLPLEMMFFVDDSSGGPKLALGFDDVDYPESYKKQGLRVGLEQLAKMREQGYKLHIPIKTFDNKGHGNARRIYFPLGGAKLTLVSVNKKDPAVTEPATTDPVLRAQENAVGTLFADIVSPTGNGDRPYVDKSHMYLTLDLKDCEIDFHEGYEYEVSTSFLDESDEGQVNPCYSDLYLVIKVVPEFVTWDAHEIGSTGYYSASWYNDENWKRSTRAQLYKDKNGETAQQNTPTPGHPDGYDDDTEIDSRLEGNPGFVPMKFTNVVLLGGNHAPSLIREVRVAAGTGRSAANQGGSLIDPSNLTGTQMLTDTSPYTHLYSSYPTENIRYDMMVRYGDHAHGGEGCFGHRHLGDDGTWADHTSSHGHGTYDANAKVFDVEKFYGNTCKDIYFKHGAELLRQQRLYYQKAWVERELEANRWSLVSTPLKSTYAGDMYVPTKMTDVSLETPAEVKGRQVTEAFQPMNFSTTAIEADRTNKVSSQPAYSRTKYPIYQRSWATDGSLVWTKTDDMRRNNYSANLPYSSVSSVDVEWSHTYNDVQVPYHTLTGFSIRPHKQDQTLLSLIRLPKDDTSYQYFDWTDTGSNPAGGQQTVDKSAIQNLTYYYGDNNPHQELSMYRLKIDDPQADGNYTVDVSDLQVQDNYLLVGNPTMASVNMSKFFEVNTDLARGYWTYENGALKAYLVSSDYTVTDSENNKGGIIKPLQAFFVKKGSASQISFTRGMAIDGNFPGDVIVPASPGGGSRPFGLVLSAAGVKGSSSAMVSQSGDASNDYVEGEDVETLFDSNLSDVPLVYTVADGRAVSIDNRQEISVIPFGVTQAMTAPVDVSVTGIATSMTPIYFVDALTGVSTELAENATVSVQPNDYGRYFLVRDPLTLSTKDVNGGIVISVRDGQVTVTASDNLSRVVAMSAGGVQTFAQKDCGRTCSFQLQSGIYIIEASTQSGSKTFKVMVK